MFKVCPPLNLCSGAVVIPIRFQKQSLWKKGNILFLRTSRTDWVPCWWDGVCLRPGPRLGQFSLYERQSEFENWTKSKHCKGNLPAVGVKEYGFLLNRILNANWYEWVAEGWRLKAIIISSALISISKVTQVYQLLPWPSRLSLVKRWYLSLLL